MSKSSLKVKGFSEKPSNVKNHSIRKVLITILVLALIGGLIYYLYPMISQIKLTNQKTLIDLYNSRRA